MFLFNLVTFNGLIISLSYSIHGKLIMLECGPACFYLILIYSQKDQLIGFIIHLSYSIHGKLQENTGIQRFHNAKYIGVRIKNRPAKCTDKNNKHKATSSSNSWNKKNFIKVFYIIFLLLLLKIKRKTRKTQHLSSKNTFCRKHGCEGHLQNST